MEIIEILAPLGYNCRPNLKRTGFRGITIHNTSNNSVGAKNNNNVFYLLKRLGEGRIKYKDSMAESQSQMEAAAQTMNFYIIDMKKMKFKDANLPKIVLENTPKYQKIAIIT